MTEPADPGTASGTATVTPLGPVRARLGRVTPTRRPPASNAYSRSVRLLKVVLPALAVGIVLLVFVWPQLKFADGMDGKNMLEITPEDAERLKMTNPRFVGTDDQGHPFSVIAKEALQPAVKSDKLSLVEPSGDMTVEDGHWVSLSANDGIYDRKQSTLALAGNVTLYHDDGYEIRSEEAFIDLSGGTASGDRPVQGQGPLGEIEGEGFRVRDRGDTLIVTGQSRMVVNMAGTENP